MSGTLKKSTLALILAAGLLASLFGCAVSMAGANGADQAPDGNPSSIYGNWQNSQSLLEEQLMRESGASPGISNGEKETPHNTLFSRFRNTAEGEPLVIHEFVNQIIVDDELVKIKLHAKTSDSLGDAGFTLAVENLYQPLTPVGNDNYLYITPVMGTWTVNGVKLDPQTEGWVYPAKPGTIYLYFDGLSTIDELTRVSGYYEVFLISDWWNPIGRYYFSQE